MPATLVFDDGHPTLAPLTDFRASFDVRTGVLTTLERLRRVHELDVAGLLVPEALAALTRERHTLPVNSVPELSGSVLLVNGACAVPPPQLEALSPGERLIEKGTGRLIAAYVTPNEAARFAASGVLPPTTAPTSSSMAPAAIEIPQPALLAWPWSVRTFRDKAIAEDLEFLTSDRAQEPPIGVLGLGEEPLVIHPTAVVYPGVTLDLEHGPIVIGEKAVVRPGAILIGPCAVGAHATVLERATIRGQTVLGPWCKVNGEVGGTIFQSYTNKGHDGYLGDSYVGEWVNLGAGTTGSNLLNTYGEIPAMATPGGSFVRTGEQFLGAIIGDHVKTAIATRLMTGCVLHTGGMFATTAPVQGCVAPFTWATDAGSKGYRLDKFTEVMRAAMARRKIEPSAAYLARLRELHARSSVGSER